MTIQPLPGTGQRPFGRRLLLGGALASLLGVGACSPSQPPATVATLTATNPFYVAHRGGGGDWPELTAYAYQQASKVPGLRALEFSVCQTADGVLVCSHDKTTTRATGVPYVIAEQTWKTLSSLMVTAAETDDPQQPARPFTRFDDVIDRYVKDFVVFVEPKDSIAANQLMAKMVSLGHPERVVWKQPVDSSRFHTAKQQGFSTWGYVLNEPAHVGANLTRFAASRDIDMLGAPRAESDAFVATVVAAADRNAKATIMWEIRDDEDRARAMRLGCRGLMTSRIAEVMGAPL